MDKELKNKMIKNYIINLSSHLNNQYKGIMDDDKIYRAIEMFKNSDKEYDDIIIEIQNLAKKIINNYIEFEKQIQEYMHKQFTDEQLDLFSLDLRTDKNGLYLSQQQVDLLMITELSSKNQIKNYIENICGQFPYKKVEDIFPDFNLIENPDDIKIENWRRSLYQQYIDTLITYLQDAEITDKSSMARLKLSKLGIKGNELEEWVTMFKSEGMIKTLQELEKKYGNEFIIKFNHFIKDDFENVGSISYDQMASLNDFIKRDSSIDTIIIATGKFGNMVYQTGYGMVFDPFFTKKSMQYCLNSGKHMRYHTLFGHSHVDKLIKAGKGIKDHDEILTEMRKFIKESFEFIEKNNITLPDGTKFINTVEVFNELVEKNKDDKDHPYEMVWEKYFGITIEEILSCFDGIKKPDGVEFMYNETTLTESSFKRAEVEKVLYQIEQIRPNFIDSFGDQMHLSDEDVLDLKGINNLSQTFEMLKRIQTGKLIVDGQEKIINGKKVECTEHDFHFTRKFLEQYKIVKDTNSLSENNLYAIKKSMQEKISSLSTEKGVDFSRTTYWSIFDTNDHNMCRTNIKIQQENKKRQELGIKEKPLYISMNAGLIKKDKNFSSIKNLRKKENSEKVDYENSREKEKKELIKIRDQLKIIKAPEIKNSTFTNKKVKVKIKTNSTTKNNSSGFSDALILALIAGFACGIIFTITFAMFN